MRMGRSDTSDGSLPLLLESEESSITCTSGLTGRLERRTALLIEAAEGEADTDRGGGGGRGSASAGSGRAKAATEIISYGGNTSTGEGEADASA